MTATIIALTPVARPVVANPAGEVIPFDFVRATQPHPLPEMLPFRIPCFESLCDCDREDSPFDRTSH
jgi:hypothetical protein